jgi:GTP cyclohydrolase IA
VTQSRFCFNQIICFALRLITQTTTKHNMAERRYTYEDEESANEFLDNSYVTLRPPKSTEVVVAEPRVQVSELENDDDVTDTTGGGGTASTDSNIDTFTSTVQKANAKRSDVTYCPIRALGQMCICDHCETARLQLLRNRSQCNSGVTRPEIQVQSKMKLPSQLIARTDPTPELPVTTGRSKRPREVYKQDEGGDFLQSADDHTSILDTPSSVVITGTIRNLTTTTAAAVVNHAILDPEQQKIQIMSNACRTILQCIGEDPEREGLQKTPERWAKALLYLCHGYHLSPQEVTNNAVFYENHNEMVVVRNIDIHSLCEHHMVPFTGHVHIGYIPNGKIIGLSKLARLADVFARRLQVQERLTRQIADAILETIAPLGVAVVMECTHYCMVMRGVQKTGTITTTSSVRGCFETNSKTRAEFFSILHGGGR